MKTKAVKYYPVHQHEQEPQRLLNGDFLLWLYILKF